MDEQDGCLKSVMMTYSPLSGVAASCLMTTTQNDWGEKRDCQTRRPTKIVNPLATEGNRV